MVRITDSIVIEESEIHWDFIRASGPGGQNVNKVSSAVKLRFDVVGTSSLSDDVRQRLIRLAGRRVNNQGILTIDARRFRSQERNRQDALERFISLVSSAAIRPKYRKKTRPSKASKMHRLENKRQRSAVKRLRSRSDGME